MPYPHVELTGIRTYHLGERPNLVHREDLIYPGDPPPPFKNPEFDEVIARIVEARRRGAPVILMYGAHVIKNGLGPILIDLIKHGIVTHLATNGAGTIHDTELAIMAETSEDVATSIEDGTFGMAWETGAVINQAVQAGARDGIGYGEALGRLIATDDRFENRDISVLPNAYALGVPLTAHITIGTDIIHQHPLVDFGALGWASGHDFKVYCHSVSQLEGGVFLNFGSAVTGPEVFLKALSIARNLGHTVSRITTANFDLLPLKGDYHRKLGYDNPEYYYRPRKNIVNRPVSLGGKGFHITGDHKETLPNLLHRVREAFGSEWEARTLPSAPPVQDPAAALPEGVRAPLEGIVRRYPELTPLAPEIARAYRAIADSFARGGTLYLCGNGGSQSDALHIAGELLKAFKAARPLRESLRAKLSPALAQSLQDGLPAVALGANPALTSAVQNDIAEPHVIFAQELQALAKPGDVFIGISTSGTAQNVRHAAAIARALSMPVIALVGKGGGPLSAEADVTICSPRNETATVQEHHLAIYHALCEMVERRFYG